MKEQTKRYLTGAMQGDPKAAALLIRELKRRGGDIGITMRDASALITRILSFVAQWNTISNDLKTILNSAPLDLSSLDIENADMHTLHLLGETATHQGFTQIARACAYELCTRFNAPWAFSVNPNVEAIKDFHFPGESKNDGETPLWLVRPTFGKAVRATWRPDSARDLLEVIAHDVLDRFSDYLSEQDTVAIRQCLEYSSEIRRLGKVHNSMRFRRFRESVRSVYAPFTSFGRRLVQVLVHLTLDSTLTGLCSALNTNYSPWPQDEDLTSSVAEAKSYWRILVLNEALGSQQNVDI